nr:hypothetical protein CFP56_11955 [Quercus suber]
MFVVSSHTTYLDCRGFSSRIGCPACPRCCPNYIADVVAVRNINRLDLPASKSITTSPRGSRAYSPVVSATSSSHLCRRVLVDANPFVDIPGTVAGIRSRSRLLGPQHMPAATFASGIGTVASADLCCIGQSIGGDGYESTIPPLSSSRHVLGRAQTAEPSPACWKTACFP